MKGEQRQGGKSARNLGLARGVLGRTEGSSRDVVPIRGEFTTPETTVVPQEKQRDTAGRGGVLWRVCVLGRGLLFGGMCVGLCVWDCVYGDEWEMCLRCVGVFVPCGM